MTGSRSAFGLLAVSGALCLTIAFEISSWQADDSAHWITTPAAGPNPDASPNAGTAPVRDGDLLDEILEHPLFSPDRRPVDAGVKGLPRLPRLAGIVVAGSQRVAIFAAEANDHPIVAPVGAHVGAYEVRTIADSGVTVVGPEGATLIRPIFDVARPAAAVPPPARKPAAKP